MMFSYSKRLALLLTVCGTLLSYTPLSALTEAEKEAMRKRAAEAAEKRTTGPTVNETTRLKEQQEHAKRQEQLRQERVANEKARQEKRDLTAGAAEERLSGKKKQKKEPWYAKWKFWGKKKETETQDSAEQLIQQIDTKVASIQKLKTEIRQQRLPLEESAKKELNARRKEALQKRILTLSETWKKLEQQHQKLASHRISLSGSHAMPSEKILKIKRDIKESEALINKTYGRTRRVTSWIGKKAGWKKTPPSDEQKTQDLSGAIQKHMQDINTLSGELNASSQKISNALAKTTDTKKRATLEKAQEDCLTQRTTLADFHELMQKDAAQLKQPNAFEHLSSIQEDVAKVDAYVKDLKGKTRRLKEWFLGGMSKVPGFGSTKQPQAESNPDAPKAVDAPTITLTPADD